MTEPEPHFARTAGWPEVREHLVKHQALLDWLESRLNSMGVPGISWVHSAELGTLRDGTEKVLIGVERYDESEHLDFTWAELQDETNETYERIKRERREAELKRRAKQEKAETEQRVARLERELEAARAKLEDDA